MATDPPPALGWRFLARAFLRRMLWPVMTVPVTATLDKLQDLFDEHPFLGMPVVEADGKR